MAQRLFSIRTTDQYTALRGRLLKGTLLILAIVTAGFVPFAGMQAGMGALIGSLFMLLIYAVAFALAHRGHVLAGALLLITTLLTVIAFGTPPDEMIGHSPGTFLVLPVLIAGLVIGTEGVVVFGAVSLVTYLSMAVVYRQQIAWTDESTNNLMLIVLISALVWLIIRMLERSLTFAQAQANDALQSQEELRSQQQALVAANSELKSSNEQLESLLGLVRELEIPVIPLLEGVLVVPLVGHLDTRRVDQINRAVLEAVYQQRARTVIIDITGISVVDTAVAQRIEQLAQSIQLLGARVMLTGIRAEMAQAIVDLGLNFATIRTAGRLQDGVAAVLSELSSHN